MSHRNVRGAQLKVGGYFALFGYYDDNSSLYHIKGYTVPLRRTKVYSSIIKRAGISLGGVERIPPSMNILKATFTVNVSTNTRTLLDTKKMLH